MVVTESNACEQTFAERERICRVSTQLCNPITILVSIILVHTPLYSIHPHILHFVRSHALPLISRSLMLNHYMQFQLSHEISTT